MTGQQLRAWRLSAGLTLRETAAHLGNDIAHTTLSRWESSDAQLPEWVAAKILGQTEIKLPLDVLHQLLDVARKEGKSFGELLGHIIKSHLESRRDNVESESKPAAPAPVNTGAAPTKTAPAAASPSTIIPLPPQHFVAAEEAPEYGTKKQPKKG